MAKDAKPPPKVKPLDEHGLEPNVRKRILSYGAPDRRHADPKATVDVPKGRRRDDHPENSSR
jgi:hypothetical protein